MDNIQIKRIQCPNCHQGLEVRNSKNEDVKRFKCPACDTPLKLFFKPQQPQATSNGGETQLGGSINNGGGETQLGGYSIGSTQLYTPPQPKAVSVCLVYNGKEYPLSDGRNIVGRAGTTSQATVQIDTPDRYMSRQHCIIDVATLSDGMKKAVLGNYQNKNITAVDGHEVFNGDEIRLTDGNVITMGHTTITIKIS